VEQDQVTVCLFGIKQRSKAEFHCTHNRKSQNNHGRLSDQE
jgi:hypothetical protein